LFKRNVNVSRIFDVKWYKGYFFEIIEYIPAKRSNSFDCKKAIYEIAKMHNVSYAFHLPYNISVIDSEVTIRGVVLNKILLGFNEKFYEYPLKNINEKQQFYNQSDRFCIENLINIYKTVFYNFTAENNIKECICHNDISVDNVIFNKDECYIIDFDFLSISSEYVDLIDAIILRNLPLKEINRIIGDNNELGTIQKIYYKENRNYPLNIWSIKQMILLKIVSFYFYIKAENITRLDFDFLQSISRFVI
jgi:hypothetical protein